MVAAGGGGSAYYNNGAAGGGLIGINDASKYGASGTQTTGAAFGKGGTGINTIGGGGGGGGSGYYGGSGGLSDSLSGGGGSSFILGHVGCSSIKNGVISTNALEKYFLNTEMIDGAGYKWSTSPDTIAINMPTHDGTSTMTGNSGNGYAKVTYVSTIPEFNEPTIYEYLYYGVPQILTVPKTGYYQVELWGAQGGNYNSLKGGYGGYSEGITYLTSGTTIYVNIGGTTTSLTGGYNGGGIGGSSGRGGGGATHIATESGLLSTLSSKTDKILIVAGGGGGAEGWSNGCLGGSGGGQIGVSGNYTGNVLYNSAKGGTQLSGGEAAYLDGYASYPGSFGIGGNSHASYGGAGGGGYYGGGGGGSSASVTYSGGGGSGYIGSSALQPNKRYMYCYGCTESSNDTTYTISTTGTSSLRDTVNCPIGYSEVAISKCAKSGNGAAKLTYIGETLN